MTAFAFDDAKIRWQKLGDFEHFVYSILDVDDEAHIYDVVFKFHAGKQIVLHRHLAQNNMFVIQGEHRLYHADGRVKDVRPTGTYTNSAPDPEPHREGGGADQDVVVFFSIRGKEGVLYEILDDDENVIGTVSSQDLVALHQAARTAA